MTGPLLPDEARERAFARWLQETPQFAAGTAPVDAAVHAAWQAGWAAGAWYERAGARNLDGGQ